MASRAVPPSNFSWVDPHKLAAMACPRNVSHMQYLIEQNVKHLVTLSPDSMPPVQDYLEQLKWTLIEVEEFEAPSISDIIKFISICEENIAAEKAVGVHCRQGWGRTGVMLACYMVYFKESTPQTAITNVRLQRPGSIETYEQELVVSRFRDYVRSVNKK